MHLPRLVRTSSFRLTLLYAAIFCVSFIVLFQVIFWSTAHFMQAQIDQTVSSEIAEIRSEAGAGNVEAVKAVINALSVRSPDFYYLLQDSSQHKLAGNLPSMEPAVGVHEWATPDRNGVTNIRGRGLGITDGDFLFVGLSTFQRHEMQEMVTRSFLWGLGGTVILALIGGLITSASLLRRVEAATRASLEIMDGDLSKRLPLRGTNDEFDRLAQSFNEMLDRNQRLMEGLQQVSTDIAHDLRTPLTRLRQRLELARRRARSVDAFETFLDGTVSEVDAILDIFSALLRIAQIESHARRAGFGDVDLTEALKTVVEAYQPAAEDKGQVVDSTIAEGLTVRGDRDLLVQMFANLLENASRHTPSGTKIEVSATRDGRAAVVEISDDGPGVPEAVRTKLFQRFFRLEESRSTPGSGLGLSMVAAIAALHRTAVQLSDNGPGLRVRVRLATQDV